MGLTYCLLAASEYPQSGHGVSNCPLERQTVTQCLQSTVFTAGRCPDEIYRIYEGFLHSPAAARGVQGCGIIWI